MKKQIIDHENSNDPKKNFSRVYVYDGQEVLLEFSENNDLLVRYTHSSLRTDDVLSMDVTPKGAAVGAAKKSDSYHFLKDHLGTVKALTDSSGDVVQRHNYSAYGVLVSLKDKNGKEVTEDPVVKSHFGFTGREYDWETGLHYYRARYYDAKIGRFLQADPAPGRADIPVSVVNGYFYVSNNPLNFNDPLGKFKIRFTVLNNLFEAFNIGSKKDRDRFDNVSLATAALVLAFTFAPVTAAVAVGTTAVQNRNKKGNFFDNLDDLAQDFTINFVFAVGFNELMTVGTTEGQFVRDLAPTLFNISFSLATGTMGVLAKEELCRKANNLRGGEVFDFLDSLGFVADRRGSTCPL